MMKLESPALVLERLHTLPRLEPITLDEPGPNEVRVKMSVSGVCHTDLAAVRDALGTPMVLGHEGAGIVESVGEQVTTLVPGDHVILASRAPCGECRRCRSGRQDLCETPQATARPRAHLKNGTPLELLGNLGAFCEYVTIPAGSAVRVRRDIPLDKAALISCGVATGIGAVLRSAAVQPGETVVVFGTGGVGLNIVQAAQLAQASMIIAIDRVEQKLALARQFGATHTVRADETDSLQAVFDLTHGRGVDYAFEVVGAPALMDQAIRTLNIGGMLLLVGGAPRDASFAFAPRALLAKQQTIRGCNYGSLLPALDLPMYADWYMQGRIKLDELLTGEITLDELPGMYQTHAAPEAIRTIVRFAS